MADDIRQRIIASVFSKRSPSGALEEQYIAHIKIYEDVAPGQDDGGRKARYILLSLSLKGPALLHKSRENTNGSFSVGKTWDLKELTALEVSGRNPGFDISFARRYRWTTESWDDQEAFLVATVRLYRRINGGQSPQLTGWRMPDGPTASMASRSSAATSAAGEDSRSNRSATPPLPNAARRLQVSTTSAGYSDTPPRASSPNMLTPRQIAGMRSASPTRQGMLRAPTPGQTSFDQPPPTTGRSINGGRRSPSPGPSPRSAYANATTPIVPGKSPLSARAEMPSPGREQPPGTSREMTASRLGRRPTDAERPSYERDRSREPGLPSNPRRGGGSRSDRAPSPPPNWDVPPQNGRNGRSPAPRSDRAPSPQPQMDQVPYRNGIPASPRRPRAGSRSERSDRAPSPSPIPGPVPVIPPLTLRRDREREKEQVRAPSPNPPSEASFRRPRASPRADRAPSPNPLPDPALFRRPRAGSRSETEPSRGPSPAPPPPKPVPTPRAGARVDRELPTVDTASPQPKRMAKPRTTPTPSPQVELSDPRERLPLPPVSLGQGIRKDPYARISFYDPANQAMADRLLAGSGSLGEEESNEATMANIEEMLEGYEWGSIGTLGTWGEPKGAADQIEARLLKELSALDAANMYSFVEADDRVATVITFIEEALKEIEEMDGSINSYNIHLNAVDEDISYIQSQNRGLQVQTQNQRSLLKELEGLLETVQVDREVLLLLTNQGLGKRDELSRLEVAATELYKALQAGKDTDMAASMQRLDEYRTYNHQLCSRTFDFVSMMITYQADLILKGKGKKGSDSKLNPLVIASHRPMEDELIVYAGLIRYMKEMDETRYGKLCGAYFGAVSRLYNDQTKILLETYLGLIRRVTEEESDMNFAPPSSNSALSRGATMRRAGTIVRSPLDRTKEKDKDKGKQGELRGYEAFGKILDQISPLTYREEEFLSNFLQINETGETFADYMNLDSYFRRQASRWVGLSRETQKLLRGAMDLIFSFLPDALKRWIDDVLELDKIQMIGIIAHLERYKIDAEERGNAFLARFLQKHHARIMAHQARHVDELIKSIEATKLSSKKRKGVVHYIKYFPIFVNRVEGQLTGADSFEIRTVVDTSYEKIVSAMFESLQQMAKLEGEGEDKGQLNYHVILIENMHSFINDLSQQSLGSMAGFTKRAETIYDENLTAYVRLVLRRPFPKLVDFVESGEKLLKNQSPSDVASSATHNKAMLKKLLKDTTAKDVKRNIDAMFKRVEKHFAEDEAGGGSATGVAMPGTVLLVAWKACEDELIGITERLLKFISTCHKDSSAEYSVTDVEAAFRKHKA